METKNIPAVLGILTFLITLMISSNYFSSNQSNSSEKERRIVSNIDNSISTINEYILTNSGSKKELDEIKIELAKLKNELDNEKKSNAKNTNSYYFLMLLMLIVLLICIIIYQFYQLKNRKTENVKLAKRIIELKEGKTFSKEKLNKKSLDKGYVYDLLKLLNEEVKNIIKLKEGKVNLKGYKEINKYEAFLETQDMFALLGDTTINKKISSFIKTVDQFNKYSSNENKELTEKMELIFHEILDQKKDIVNHIGHTYQINPASNNA